MNIIFIGPPGSGKSTQAKKIAEALNLLHISTGDVIRKLHEQEDPAVEESYQYLLRGEWVPDDLIIGLLKNWINRFPDTEGIVLDGFPRTVPQAKILDQQRFLPGTGTADKVVYVNTSQAECLARLIKRAEIEHRADETQEAIEQRLEEFRTKTEPVLDYYRQKGIVLEVDGDGTIEEIYQEIISQLPNPPSLPS